MAGNAFGASEFAFQFPKMQQQIISDWEEGWGDHQALIQPRTTRMWNDIDVNHILKYEYNFERNKNYFIYEAVLQAGYKPRDRRNAETNAAT